MGDVVVEKFRRLFPDLQQVKDQFSLYDENKDGNISQEELVNGMTASKDFNKEQALNAFELADANGDGQIDISEFIQLMFPGARETVTNIRKTFLGPNDIERKFKSWDSDGDGKLSYEELKEAVAKDSPRFMSEEDVNALFVIGDLDLDGSIDYNEFCTLMIPSVSDIVAKFRYMHRTVTDVRKAFKKCDTNGDGRIDKGELNKALTHYKLNFTDQEVDVIFKEGDKDSDGEIDYEEFMYLMCPDATVIISKFRGAYKTLNEVKTAFKKFDKNRDGSLSKGEMSRMMFSTGHSYTDTEVDAIMNLGDLDGDGEISLDEFVTLMSPGAAATLSQIRQNYKSINEVKQLFKAVDVDSDGLLTKEEMINSDGNKFDMEQIDAIFELGDANNDNQLDMGEFIAILFPAAGEVIAKLSKTVPTIDQVKELFRRLDLDNDGSVSKSEMLESSVRFSPEEVEAIFALGDVNDDGVIDLVEFIGVMYPSASTVAGRLRAKYLNINDVKKAFAKIDTNGDGNISREEMLACGSFNSQEVEALFTLGDSNKDGEIDLEEFVGVLYPVVAQALLKFTKDIQNVDDARFLFKQLDKDGDGLLSQEELRKCGTKFSAKEIEALFAIGDINSDGEIDLDEFINVMCPAATTVIARISSSFQSTEDIEACFTEMDLNKDGKISRCEMSQYSKLNEQEVNAVFELGDADRDGEIDLKEFLAVMQTTSPVPYTEGGEMICIGDHEVYKVGASPKCVVWCHDAAGFAGSDRTRQLVDKLSTAGYMLILPNFFTHKQTGSAHDANWIKSNTDWSDIRTFWVDYMMPYLRDTLAVKTIGVVGTGWGAYIATRIASYGEVSAGVIVNPSVSTVVEALAEDLYEVYEEVSCPQLVITSRDDCPNEKSDGLAYRIFKSCVFGKACDFIELDNTRHGYLLDGDRSIEDVAINVKVTMSAMTAFFNKHLGYLGEELPVDKVTDQVNNDDFDLKHHSSDCCRVCLEVRHQANKFAMRNL